MRITAFGEQTRARQPANDLILRDSAKKTKVTFTDLSEVENQQLSFGEFPGDDLIVKLARALEADPDELLPLAEKIASRIPKRDLQRPYGFRKMAVLYDRRLSQVLKFLDRGMG